MINKIKIKPCASLPGQGSKCQMSVKMAASMELGDLGFLCDRKPCSESIFYFVLRLTLLMCNTCIVPATS